MDHFAARVLRSGFVISLVTILAVLVLEQHKSSATPSRATALTPPSTEGPARVAAECAAEPLPTADVTYVCDCGEGAARGCRAGDDAASGSDPEHALRTVEAAAAKFNAMRGGGTVALCRGGSFRVSSRLESRELRMQHVVPVHAPRLRAGRVGSPPAPRLLATNDAIAFIEGGAANRDGGYRVRNVDLVGQRAGTGIFVFNDVSDLDVCNVTIRGFQIGMHVAGANAPDLTGQDGPASDGRNRGIRLRGSRIEENFDMGYLGSCIECAVESNVFRGNAKAGTVLNHPIYFDTDGSGERIVGNVLLESVHDRRGHCNGVVIVAHGRHDGITIEDNAIYEVRRRGRSAPAGASRSIPAKRPSPSASSTSRSVAIGSTTSATSESASPHASTAPVEDNVIRQGNAFEATGIEAPDRPNGPGDATLTRLTVRSNRITFRGSAIGTGIRLGDEGEGHVIRENTLAQRGPGSFACIDAAPRHALDPHDNRCVGGAGQRVGKPSPD